VPDERLIQLLDDRPRVVFQGEAFRHVGPNYPPLGTEGARIQGGRWNPPDSFPTLYLAANQASAAAEFYRRSEREGRSPEELLPRRLFRYRVRLTQVVDLTTLDGLASVSLSVEDLTMDDPTRCQAIGDAAHYVGFEAIRAPSATEVGEVLAVFWDRLQPDSVVENISAVTWDDLPVDPRDNRPPVATGA
jgi:RES domain-containing protein